MKRKIKLSTPMILLSVALLVSMIPLPAVTATEPTIAGTTSLAFDIEPTQSLLADEYGPGGGSPGAGETPYNLDMIDIENVCETGEDIYVAVLDTGLLYNWMEYLPVTNIVTEWGKGFSYEYAAWDEEYGAFFLYNRDEDRGFITMEPYGSGHGTQVTSTITGFNYVSGSTGEEFWVEGVAPDVKIIPVLVLDAWVAYYPPGGYYVLVTGGSNWMVSSGIRYCADLAEQEGIKIIINMSLGGAYPSTEIKEAIDYAISKGCIVVVAAGNEGEEGMDYPGAYPQVISVAAGGWTMQWLGDGVATRWWLSDVPECFWTEDDLGNDFQLYLTDFSGRPNPELGQSICDLDVCTPGAWVLGPYRPYLGSFGYWYVGGTSQATPHVSGIAALVLDKYPHIGQCKMELILKTAGLFHRMTKWFRDGSALVYDYDPDYGWDFYEFTWGPFDYGSGFLQADAAMWVAWLYSHFCMRRPTEPPPTVGL